MQQIERFAAGLIVNGAGVVQTAWFLLHESEIMQGLQDELCQSIVLNPSIETLH